VLQEVSDYLKENRKLKLDARSVAYNAKYQYMFSYIGKKLEQFSN